MNTTDDKLSLRQEAFCHEYTLMPNGRRAAVRAGYAPASAHVQASRMLRNDKVLDRIMENRAEIAARHCQDSDAFMTKLEAIYRVAFEHGNLTAAVRAVELQTRLAGLAPTPLLTGSDPASGSTSLQQKQPIDIEKVAVPGAKHHL